MAPLPGKKQMMMRMGANILNFIGIVLVNVFIATGIESLGNPMALIAGPIVMSVITIFLLKAEYDFLDDHRNVFLVLGLLIGIGLDAALGYTMSGVDPNTDVWLFYLPMNISLFMLILYWHYTLTIYKKEFMKHLVGFFLFIGIFLGFGIVLIGLLAIIPVMIVVVALVVNQYAIIDMTQKKLLKLIE